MSFETWGENVELAKMSSAQLQYHKFENKAGKLLANLTKGHYHPTHIMTLHNSDGSLSSTPKDISKTLKNFFTKLYAQEPIDLQAATSYLGSTNLPLIDPDHLRKLNAPITEEESNVTIRGLSNGKAPGPDGYAPEFYKLMREEITPPMLLVCNSIWDGGPYLPTGHQAYIKLIAKKDKGPKDPGSYRPISLLNIDSKILCKVVASRLANIMPSLIHKAQLGFIKGRSASSNLRKVLAGLSYAKQHPLKDLAIITLDAENAFDHVSFQWLSLVMQKFGMSGPFCHFIHNLYSAHYATIIAAGVQSNPIRLHKDTV